tara:strand:- start:8788 stop:8934 length:147 start_codon:yes stop_codon:yes gene_type:complete
MEEGSRAVVRGRLVVMIFRASQHVMTPDGICRWIIMLLFNEATYLLAL